MPEKRVRQKRRIIQTPKNCPFCTDGTMPWFSEVATLQKYISDRGKILSRSRTGICAKHQRRLTTAVKHARHLALLPFVARE